MNLLFICSKNQWRSPTAEQLFRSDTTLSVRSRGTSRSARRTVSASDIEWADLVLVMETRHKKRLVAEYPDEMAAAKIHVLDIPDDYQYMDPELVELLTTSVTPLLESLRSSKGSDSQALIPRTVQLGRFTKRELLAELRSHGIQLNQAALELFADTRFQPRPHAGNIHVEVRSVDSLGFFDGAKYSQLIERAATLGLTECPLELAAYLRLQYFNQPVAAREPVAAEPGSPPGALTVASALLDATSETPKGFYLRNIDGELWLRGYWSNDRHVWGPSDLFVFWLN